MGCSLARAAAAEGEVQGKIGGCICLNVFDNGKHQASITAARTITKTDAELDRAAAEFIDFTVEISALSLKLCRYRKSFSRLPAPHDAAERYRALLDIAQHIAITQQYRPRKCRDIQGPIKQCRRIRNVQPCREVRSTAATQLLCVSGGQLQARSNG